MVWHPYSRSIERHQHPQVHKSYKWCLRALVYALNLGVDGAQHAQD